MTDLYIYEDDEDCFVVRKTGETSDTSFSGEVVEVKYGNFYQVGHISKAWSKAEFDPYNPNSHPRAKLIHAWADGAEIEYYDPDLKKWYDACTPSWDAAVEYRIKQVPKFETVNFVQWFDGENLFWLKEGVEPKTPSRKVKDSVMTLEIEK